MKRAPEPNKDWEKSLKKTNKMAENSVIKCMFTDLGKPNSFHHIIPDITTHTQSHSIIITSINFVNQFQHII